MIWSEGIERTFPDVKSSKSNLKIELRTFYSTHTYHCYLRFSAVENILFQTAERSHIYATEKKNMFNLRLAWINVRTWNDRTNCVDTKIVVNHNSYQ